MIVSNKRLRLKSSVSILKQIREALGLTQVELAELLSIQPNSIYRWESGRIEAKLTLEQIQILESLLAQLGLSFGDFPAPTFGSPMRYNLAQAIEAKGEKPPESNQAAS